MNYYQPTTTQSDIWRIACFYVPEDSKWLEPTEKIFMGMQVNALRETSIRLVFTSYPALSDQDIPLVLKEAKLSLALVSPDFLASGWMLKWNDLCTMARAHQRRMIPIMIRACEWQGGQVIIPRHRAIEKIKNDTVWIEVSNEIRRVMEKDYPDCFPQRRRW